jgi:AcrR family transcriptional regulator
MKINELAKEPSQHAELQARIIETASQLFRSKGVKSITMDEIAAAMGISKRTLYELFIDKEALLLKCMQCMQEVEYAYAKDVYDHSANVMEVILKLYQRSIEQYGHIHHKFFDEIRKYPMVNAYLKSAHEHDADEKVAFFRTGVEQGLFRSDINFEIINMLVREQFTLLANSEMWKQFSFLEVYESIMFTYLRGIATEKGQKVLEAFIQKYRNHQNE